VCIYEYSSIYVHIFINPHTFVAGARLPKGWVRRKDKRSAPSRGVAHKCLAEGRISRHSAIICFYLYLYWFRYRYIQICLAVRFRRGRCIRTAGRKKRFSRPGASIYIFIQISAYVYIAVRFLWGHCAQKLGEKAAFETRCKYICI